MPDTISVMTNHLIDCFFYGLFMDADVLKTNGVAAHNPRHGRLNGFSLRIGQRATLVRAEGATAWGLVYALTQADIDKLYTAPGLADYRPETVSVDLDDGSSVAAQCFNLTEAPAPHEANADYTAKLRGVFVRHGLPVDAIEQV